MCYCLIRRFKVFVGLGFWQNEKIFTNWRLINSLFVDCVGATYEKEASVNHLHNVINTRPLQIFQVFVSCLINYDAFNIKDAGDGA